MRIHIVQKGETLWRIAKQYGIGLDELKRLNTHLANPDYIVPGMEIILPEGGAATSKSSMTKEQQTAPMPSKEMKTAPKEKLTEQIVKEQPAKEVPKKVETAPIPAPIPQPMPAPVPMPIPQVDLMPQFQFDFAPQMHFQQPRAIPAPQPMPQPQPIYIQVPQPKVETKVESTVEKDVEYVQIPVPQPQIIYVCCPQPQPYGCHEQVVHHNPCGCHEQVYYHNPCGCQEQHYHQPHPCGCNDYANYYQAPYGYNEEDYQQMPQQQYNDCGCGGRGYPSQEMMYDGMQNFDPNYDMAPMTGVAPAMEDPYEDHDGLPDWLLDSSEVKAQMVEPEFEQNVGAPDFDGYNPYNPHVESEQAADPYQQGYNDGNGATPYSQNYYGTYDMQQGMPVDMNHMMPQQMMPPNCQGYPYNPYLAQNKPWNY